MSIQAVAGRDRPSSPRPGNDVANLDGVATGGL
jgi:hypothetical protein